MTSRLCIVVPLRITGASLNSDTNRLTTAVAVRYTIVHKLGSGGMATVESLRHRLSREKQLPVNDAVKIASEVADALAYVQREERT